MTHLLDGNTETETIETETTETDDISSGSDRPVGYMLLAAFGLIATLVAVAATPYIGDGLGYRSYHPTEYEQVEEHYGSGLGALNVDLSDVEFPPGVHVIEIDQGLGSASVWLPAGVNYVVSGDLDAGKIDLVGETSSGFGNEFEVQSEAGNTATVIVDLDVDMGYGQVRIG